METAPWYYMSATLGEGGHTPYHPLLDDVPMEESQPVDTEETIVATRLDGIVAVEEEGGGSLSSTIGSLREGGVHPTPDE